MPTFVVKRTFCFLFVAFILTGCLDNRPPVTLSDVIPEVEKNREATILTAFYGLDNALPPRSIALHRKAPGNDGMPIVFSKEIDPSTLDASDFEITASDGTIFGVEAVTLRPAQEAFELRTVLLIGDYGNHPENPPVTVSIVSDLLSRTGQNFRGQTSPVIPLLEGPILSYAEYFLLDEAYPYVASGAGCDCPKEGTKTVVKAVWAGGVRAIDGEELGHNEVDNFHITMITEDDTIVVNPFMLGDLGDNDNNTDLCLRETGTPIRLSIDAGIAIDPRDDQNPKTEINVVSRW